MKVQLFLSFLLLCTSMLCGCAEQHPVDTMDNTTNLSEVTAEADIEPSAPNSTQTETEPDIEPSAPDSTPTETKSDIKTLVPGDTQPDTDSPEAVLVMTVNGISLDVTWEENETVAELFAYAENSLITVNTTIYGGFEQVGSLPQSFSRNDTQMTTQPGDIVLYSGNQLVVFFGSNNWSYTKLGHINLPADELTELLSSDVATIEIKAK